MAGERRARQRGSGTVLALGLLGVLSTLLVGALVLAGAVVAAHRAASAADLAALAGAARLAAGEPPSNACARARAVAAAHGGRLDACDTRGDEAWVTVAVPVPWTGSWVGGALGDHARSRARAGPAPDAAIGPAARADALSDAS